MKKISLLLVIAVMAAALHFWPAREAPQAVVAFVAAEQEPRRVGDDEPVPRAIAEAMLALDSGRPYAGELLTVGCVGDLLREFGSDIVIAGGLDDDAPVSYALWVDLFAELFDDFDMVDIIVLATSANSPLPGGHLISDRGRFSYIGLAVDSFIDKQLRVLVRGREIVALYELLSDTPCLRNVYVSETNAAGVFVFAGGVERFFYWENGAQAGTVADVVIHDGRALSLVPVSDAFIRGTLLRVSENVLEIEGGGVFRLAYDFAVYDVSDGTARRRGRADLIVGTDAAKFYVRDDGSVGAAVIVEEAFPEKIRVVIGTSDFAGLLHSSVTVTATDDFWVIAGGERIAELSAGEGFTVPYGGAARFFFHTEPSGRLMIAGLGRSQGTPVFRGALEVAREARGFSVVNVLCLEEYLYAVVPSEMPSAYGLLASKVQAVAARSFAVEQVLANRFHALGGNIDDSVMSQVYNNLPENEISIAAVEATRGMVLWYGGSIARANFFSTSAGMTANSAEVWGGSSSPAFLRARPQFAEAGFLRGGLADEGQAAEFFRRSDFAEMPFDGHSPWFRWQAEFSHAEISALTDIGNFREMQVLRRGEGGNVIELKIAGDEAEITVASELEIRNLLRPPLLVRADGSVLSNFPMMPSTFFSFGQNEAGNIVFFGGGHGHGVGMSQNGVRGMVEMGFTLDEILGHFYPGTHIGEF